MKTIVVLGASGQVGTELCLVLQDFSDIRVVAVCRSSLAGSLLSRCGVECRTGAVARAEDARRVLTGADVVFDLALPGGPEPEARKLNRQLIRSAVAEAPRGARYVFASTYMALGVRAPGSTLKHHLVSETVYGAKKRLMEQTVFAAGRAHGREVFVLRLGQVHGELQAVSRQVLDEMSAQNTEVPIGPSNTVFVSTIAEGLVAIAEGREEPGLYMMVSSPQWSWRELHEFFASRAGVVPSIVEIPAPRPHHRAAATIRSGISAIVGRHRDFMTGYVLPHFPDLESKARAWHHRRNARAEIAENQSRPLRPYDYAYAGDAPGARLRSPTDSRSTAAAHVERVRELLSRLTH